MSEASELKTHLSPTLSVEYRGKKHNIPLAQNKSELKKLLQEKVVPSLANIKKLNPKVDFAITEYVYSKDESLEGTEKSSEKMLKSLGMDPDNAINLARISRRKGLNPVLSDRISWRGEYPDSSVDDKFLPFSNRTFVIAPMVVNEEIFQKEAGPTLEEDVEASSLFIGNAVAFDGQILLENTEKEIPKEITNKVLIGLIQPLLDSD